MHTLPKILVSVSFLVLLGHASAEESSPGVVDKVAHAIKRGASAAAKGIEHGAKAAAHGIERGATATGNAAHRVANKIGGAETSKSPASVPVTDK